jgi:hypothetical protein
MDMVSLSFLDKTINIGRQLPLTALLASGTGSLGATMDKSRKLQSKD